MAPLVVYGSSPIVVLFGAFSNGKIGDCASHSEWPPAAFPHLPGSRNVTPTTAVSG